MRRNLWITKEKILRTEFQVITEFCMWQNPSRTICLKKFCLNTAEEERERSFLSDKTLKGGRTLIELSQLLTVYFSDERIYKHSHPSFLALSFSRVFIKKLFFCFKLLVPDCWYQWHFPAKITVTEWQAKLS